MSKAVVKVGFFSDVLCIWAYVAEIRVRELCRFFGDQVRFDYHFLRVFGDNMAKIDQEWGARGGVSAYNRHVRDIAERFGHIEVHPDIWLKDAPSSSATCHQFLKAVQLLQKKGEISARPEPEFDGRTLFEEVTWRCRVAFFKDGVNISERRRYMQVAEQLGLPRPAIEAQIDSGVAMAALCNDWNIRRQLLIEGSPTYVLNDGRQKLYGNVGYRVIEANIQELLTEPGDRASWC